MDYGLLVEAIPRSWARCLLVRLITDFSLRGPLSPSNEILNYVMVLFGFRYFTSSFEFRQRFPLWEMGFSQRVISAMDLSYPDGLKTGS